MRRIQLMALLAGGLVIIAVATLLVIQRGTQTETPAPNSSDRALLPGVPAEQSRSPFRTAPAGFQMGAIPPRAPQAPPELIDLGQIYNGTLTQAWHFGANVPLPNDLKQLPQGVQTLDGVPFDLRGIVQLHGKRASLPFPMEIAGIPVGLKCRRLHFLQATGWVVPDGVEIGAYVLHYADGQTRSLPLVYGEDLREWHGRSDKKDVISRGRVAWSLPADTQKRRLFHSTHENPRPEVAIESLDFISSGTDCFPFLIALTLEK